MVHFLIPEGMSGNWIVRANLILQGMTQTAVDTTSPSLPPPATALPVSADRQARLGLLSDAVLNTFSSHSGNLSMIEDRIKGCLVTEAPPLGEIAQYLLALGGKRIRPLLVLLSGKLFGLQTPNQQIIDVAAGIELIHTATLLHDDIIDQSPTRRSQTSAYHKYGLTDTLLTGDFLLVKAFGICARLDQFVIQATEQACVELTEGEVLEGKLGPARAVSMSEYVKIISKKTASLFRLASATGSHIAGANPADVACMQRFGLQAGIAFQMVDDILDIVADADLLGKPSGTDLRQKTPSLVNLLWLQSGDPVAERYFSEIEERTDVAPIVASLRQSGIIEEARKFARQYAESAKDALAMVSVPVCEESRQSLLAILDYTLERCL